MRIDLFSFQENPTLPVAHLLSSSQLLPLLLLSGNKVENAFEISREEEKGREDKPADKPDSSRRRSTRSASSLANYRIAEALSPDPEEEKKRSRSALRPESSEVKKVKIMEPETEKGEREPLVCVTNSPVKAATTRSSRAKTGAQRRNPEECKQQ